MVDCFARLYGPRAAKPDAYVERLWAEEEWTRGCSGCHMPTGAWTNYGPALRAPIGPLHWAGAEYAQVWNGYMDGAVSSGQAAAREGVFERREVVGGACVTEELWPGVRASPGAYTLSLLRPEIVRELDLGAHGLQVSVHEPYLFAPFPDGRKVVTGFLGTCRPQ